MDAVRIAHLSDLHCDATDQWTESFEYVLDLLKTLRPHLVVITGDSVDQPLPLYYSTFCKALSKMAKELEETLMAKELEETLHILTVPGNHDYNFYGNKFFCNIMKWCFKRYMKHFFHPHDTGSEVAVSFFRKCSIALFPLDSNDLTFPFGFARGRVKSPIQRLAEMDKEFAGIAEDSRIPYSTCTKIVLLHHHPLPLPSSSFKEKIEKYMVLSNAYPFLRAACSSKIDIIMHGHKHVSSLAKYSVFDQSGTSIVISSCASSVLSDNREIKLVEIRKSGSATVDSYRASSDKFELVSVDHPREVIYYGDIRKRRYNSPDPLKKDSCLIGYVENKTKVLTIQEDGTAWVDLSLYGIQWKPKLNPKKRIIREILRADRGRIKGGVFEFGSCPLEKPLEHNQQEWRHPLLEKDDYPSPCEPEEFEISFRPKNPMSSGLDCFKLGYPLLNGFALTLREHEETYPWPNNVPREEIASISVHYPTYYLELIARFPNGFFPPSKDVHVVATYKEEHSKPSLDLLYGKRSIDHEETRFLVRKGAVRVRPELNEIAVVLKYPRPNLVYSLRWHLPVDTRRVRLLPQHRRGFKTLLGEMRKQHSCRIDGFYKGIITEFLRIDEKQEGELRVFLLAFNDKNKVLEVVRYPPQYAKKKIRNIFIGRGPAGKAFRTRKAQFWEEGAGLFDTSGDAACALERAVDGLSAVKVLALPLMYPRLLNSEWDKLDKGTGKWICPAFGVLSIVAVSENGLKDIQEYTDERREKAIANIYGAVGYQLKKHLGEILP
jgi:hypothetical protein